MYQKKPTLKPAQLRKLTRLRKRVVCERDAITPYRNEIKEELFNSSERGLLVSFLVGPADFDGSLHETESFMLRSNRLPPYI